MPDSAMDSLHYADFAPHINTRFQVQLNDNEIMEIQLVGVDEKTSSPRQEQFALTFRAPGNAPPHQWLYHLQHEQLGSGKLFLVPIGREGDALIYEAVFNRRIEADQQ